MPPRGVSRLAFKPVRRRASGRRYAARCSWFGLSSIVEGSAIFPRRLSMDQGFSVVPRRDLTRELTPRRARNFTPRTTKKIKKKRLFQAFKKVFRAVLRLFLGILNLYLDTEKHRVLGTLFFSPALDVTDIKSYIFFCRAS